jgi:hypothetical protein
MKKSDLLRIIKEEITKVLTEENIHWSAINFKKEKAEGNTPSWAQKKEGETVSQAKERMKSELKMKYGNWMDKYLNKKDMDDAHSTFKTDPEFSKIDQNLRNTIMNSLARFFYYSSNLQEISIKINRPEFLEFLDRVSLPSITYTRENPDEYFISYAQFEDGEELTEEELGELGDALGRLDKRNPMHKPYIDILNKHNIPF